MWLTKRLRGNNDNEPLNQDLEPELGEPWSKLPRHKLYKKVTSRFWVPGQIYIEDLSHLNKIKNDLPKLMTRDFAWSLCFHRDFIAGLCYEGLLPMCTALERRSNLFAMIPKLHTRRSVLDLDHLHITKQARKRLKKFKLTVNAAFDDVIAGCVAQHGESWIYPPLQRAMRSLRQQPTAKGVTMVSFELWDDNNNLVAGDIGSLSGTLYTSFSGFRTVDHSGTVQLVKTGKALALAGAKYWDFGMDMQYKRDLGARPVDREVFLGFLHSTRDQGFVVPLSDAVRQSQATNETVDDATVALARQKKKEKNELKKKARANNQHSGNVARNNNSATNNNNTADNARNNANATNTNT